PNEQMLKEITDLREAAYDALVNRVAVDPILSSSSTDLLESTERFVAGFTDLRDIQTRITHTYENQVLKPAEEMSGLYAIVEDVTKDRDSLIWPALNKSREAFSRTLVLTNGFYLTPTSAAAAEVTKNLEPSEGPIPVMMDLTDSDLQRGALGALGYRTVSWRLGIANLADNFATRARLLRDAIDGNQQAMSGSIDHLSEYMRAREM